MLDPSDRYSAICNIITLTSSAREPRQTLRKILACAKDALPVESIGLWLPGYDGSEYLSSGAGSTSPRKLPVDRDLLVR